MRWVRISAYGGKERRTGFWWGNLRERDHLGDPVVDGRIILRKIFQEVGCEGMVWIDVAPDRDRWGAVVNGVMNLGFHEMGGIS